MLDNKGKTGTMLFCGDLPWYGYHLYCSLCEYTHFSMSTEIGGQDVCPYCEADLTYPEGASW